MTLILLIKLIPAFLAWFVLFGIPKIVDKLTKKDLDKSK